jgi:hypothetical protein
VTPGITKATTDEVSSHIVDEAKRLTAASSYHIRVMNANKIGPVPIMYHYFTFSDPDSQLPLNMLGSIAIQVAVWRRDILNDLQRYYGRDKARNGEKSLQLSELEGILVKHLVDFEQAVLMLDALNESEEFITTLGCINGLLTRLPNLTVLVTSTRSATTAGQEKWPRTVEIQMQPDEDIRAVLDSQLASGGPLGHLSAEAREKIRSTLSEDADST